MDLAKLLQSSVAVAFGLGPNLVRPSTYYRPASFAPATGLSASVEVTAACSALVANYRPQELGTVAIQPGDEKVVVRASELTGISEPAAGDYIVEEGNSLRRDVVSARLDHSGLLWIFQTTRAPNLDWGDLSSFTDAEDFGDLSGATASDDWGSLI